MVDHIRTVSTRVAYENRWMRVREDNIVRANGQPGLYGVVEKPDFVVIAPVEHGAVHLVQQYRYPVRGRFWEFPQGSWETQPGADPIDVARAELAEETGLTAASIRCAGHLFECYGYSTQGYHVFLATGLRQEQPRREATEEDMVSQAFDLAEFEAMVRDGTIKDGTTIAAFGLLRLKGLL
jgi:8-oxo-dGTP pyrophosphatase MutT (NUDIX family)